jgi:hypothetical protein
MFINAEYGKKAPILNSVLDYIRRINFSSLFAVRVFCLAFPLEYSLTRQGEDLVLDFKLVPCCECCILYSE